MWPKMAAGLVWMWTVLRAQTDLEIPGVAGHVMVVPSAKKAVAKTDRAQLLR